MPSSSAAIRAGPGAHPSHQPCSQDIPSCKQLLWIKVLASACARLQTVDLTQQFSRAQKYGSIFCLAGLPRSPQVFHIFCGKHCVQSPPHGCKSLISIRKSKPPNFVAAWLAWLFPLSSALPHNFCGQDCEQWPSRTANPLIPKGNISMLKIRASASFPQFSPPDSPSHGVPVLFLKAAWITYPSLHTNCGKGCVQG
jgi:hypothetical protein